MSDNPAAAELMSTQELYELVERTFGHRRHRKGRAAARLSRL